MAARAAGHDAPSSRCMRVQLGWRASQEDAQRCALIESSRAARCPSKDEKYICRCVDREHETRYGTVSSHTRSNAADAADAMYVL